MNEPRNDDLEDLISRALRGKLTSEEQARFDQRLATDVRLRETFEEERALEKLLDRRASVPVPSNFTALVLQSLHAQSQTQPSIELSRQRGWFRFTFARVSTALTAVAVAGFLALQQYREAQQSEMARTVSAFTEVASAIGAEKVPATTVFQDFEAIRHLSLPAEAEMDLELLVALQK